MKPGTSHFLLIALASFSIHANALIIFDNGAADASRGGWSDLDQGQEIADDFLLDSGANAVTAISWSGSYFDSNTPVAIDDFTFNFYSDDLPLAPFLSIGVGNEINRTPSGLRPSGFSLDIYNYFAVIPTTVFAPDESFYLSIVNNTAGASDDWLWEQSSSVGGNGVFREMPDAPWQRVRGALAFQLHGAQVPVPGSGMLLGLGFWLLIVHRRQAFMP